jgi:hypothetical protein
MGENGIAQIIKILKKPDQNRDARDGILGNKCDSQTARFLLNFKMKTDLKLFATHNK